MLKKIVMFNEHSNGGMTGIEARNVDSKQILSMGEIENNLRLNELEEASEHTIPSPPNKYVSLPLQC